MDGPHGSLTPDTPPAAAPPSRAAGHVQENRTYRHRWSIINRVARSGTAARGRLVLHKTADRRSRRKGSYLMVNLASDVPGNDEVAELHVAEVG
jgi:hypothetical protein